MDQERAVNIILRDLKLSGIIPYESSGYIKPYLMQLWVAGYERGTRDNNLKIGYTHGNGKPIGQYNREGRLVNSFKSRAEAVKITGFSEKTIKNSIYLERFTRQGWQWRFL